MKKLLILLLIMGMTACSINPPAPKDPSEIDLSEEYAAENGFDRATFAGGCFWCIEAALQELPGVDQAVSGYTGGDSKDPTYYNHADHREAVQVLYDPEEISYQELLDTFWVWIDPTDTGGQFADRGHSYTTAIYYHDEAQKELIEASKESLENSGKYSGPIVTEILPASDFYLAEEAHQDYYIKRSNHYQLYKKGSGRADYVEGNK